MPYNIDFSEEALDDVFRLAKNELKAYTKYLRLLEELKLHPTTGTGKPHRLTGDRSGAWSRSITKKHRLVYEVFDNLVMVYVVSAYGHYDDK